MIEKILEATKCSICDQIVDPKQHYRRTRNDWGFCMKCKRVLCHLCAVNGDMEYEYECIYHTLKGEDLKDMIEHCIMQDSNFSKSLLKRMYKQNKKINKC